MYDLDGSFAFRRQPDLEVTQRDRGLAGRSHGLRGLLAGLDARTQTLDDQFALRRAFPHLAACRRRPRREPGSPSPAPGVPLPACTRAARRTGRRSPLPGTPTTCTPSSAAAASALSRRGGTTFSSREACPSPRPAAARRTPPAELPAATPSPRRAGADRGSWRRSGWQPPTLFPRFAKFNELPSCTHSTVFSPCSQRLVPVRLQNVLHRHRPGLSMKR